MSWDDIAYKYHTDKASSFGGGIPEEDIPAHGYVEFYEAALRERVVLNVLEIGVLYGCSLRFWAEVFPKARIHGIDINPECAKHAQGRISVSILDAGKGDQVAEFCKRAPIFDLIVDDGSHNGNDIDLCLKTLWGNLSANGLYTIEDIGCENFDSPDGWTGWPAMIRDWVLSRNGAISAHPTLPDRVRGWGTAVYFIEKNGAKA